MKTNLGPVIEWLYKATAGIRFKPDRKAVRAELEEHLEDKAMDLRRIFPELTEEELAVFKRGRNTHSHVPKNANTADYRLATGLEALFGFLHIAGEFDREAELFECIWQDSESGIDN